MTPQDIATITLLDWQAQRQAGIPPTERTLDDYEAVQRAVEEAMGADLVRPETNTRGKTSDD